MLPVLRQLREGLEAGYKLLCLSPQVRHCTFMLGVVTRIMGVDRMGLNGVKKQEQELLISALSWET